MRPVWSSVPVIHLVEAGLTGIPLDVSPSWIWTELLCLLCWLGLRTAVTSLCFSRRHCLDAAHKVYFRVKNFVACPVGVSLFLWHHLDTILNHVLMHGACAVVYPGIPICQSVQSIQHINFMPCNWNWWFFLCVVVEYFAVSRVLSVPSCKAIYHPVTARLWLLGFVIWMVYSCKWCVAKRKLALSVCKQRNWRTGLDHHWQIVVDIRKYTGWFCIIYSFHDFFFPLQITNVVLRAFGSVRCQECSLLLESKKNFKRTETGEHHFIYLFISRWKPCEQEVSLSIEIHLKLDERSVLLPLCKVNEKHPESRQIYREHHWSWPTQSMISEIKGRRREGNLFTVSRNSAKGISSPQAVFEKLKGKSVED